MENHNTDLNYQQLEKEYNLLFDNIRNHLGKHRKLMLRLESLQNEIASIDDKLIYLQGFIDCVTLWQRSFHDHIIRNEYEYQKIWQYIDENPLKWKEDRYYQ